VVEQRKGRNGGETVEIVEMIVKKSSQRREIVTNNIVITKKNNVHNIVLQM
jgi:hypothetical protein